MSTSIQIGFSQRVQLGWIEQTAALVLAGQTREQIETALQECLRNKLSIGGAAQRSNREKAITILLKIWASVPKCLQSLRDDGLDHLQRLPHDDHIALHWGMTMAVYPFFGVVANRLAVLCACRARVLRHRYNDAFGNSSESAKPSHGQRGVSCGALWIGGSSRRHTRKAFMAHFRPDLSRTSISQYGS